MHIYMCIHKLTHIHSYPRPRPASQPPVCARPSRPSPTPPNHRSPAVRPRRPQKRLVVKPDCLFGKRGKHDLVGLNLDANAAQVCMCQFVV